MRKVFYLALISAIYLMFLLFSSLLFAEDVTFVIGGENGKIRSLRGINIGPLSSGYSGINADLTSSYQNLGINIIRTHDYYGPLDMSTLYPDRSKDPNLSTSYVFKESVSTYGLSSDDIFASIVNNGFEPFFRIGDSWNNSIPPSDSELANWVEASVYVLKHYREGLWDGFESSFRYVEIWNEPDNEQFWPKPANFSQFLKLYNQTSKSIRAAFPTLKIGGPGITQNGCKLDNGKEWLDSFLDYIKAEGLPFDYFSWHMYSNSPEDYEQCAAYYREVLDNKGFTSIPMIISEWNTDVEHLDISSSSKIELRTGGRGAAIVTGAWINLQKRDDIEESFLYRGPDPSMDIPSFYGIFYADGKPKKIALAWEFWKIIGQYQNRVSITGSSSDIYALAGKDDNGALGVLLSNPSEVDYYWIPLFSDGTKSDNYNITTLLVSDKEDTVDTNSQFNGKDISIPQESVQFVFFTPKLQSFSAQPITSGVPTSFTLAASLKADSNDVGKIGKVYLAGVVGSNFYFYDGINWVFWGGGELPSCYSGALTASFSIPIIEGVDISNLKGVTLFIGYGLSEQDMLSRNLYSLLYQF